MTWRTATTTFNTSGYHKVQSAYVNSKGNIVSFFTGDNLVEKYLKNDKLSVGYKKITYSSSKWFGAWECEATSALNKISGASGGAFTDSYYSYAIMPLDDTKNAPIGSKCFGSTEQNPIGGLGRVATLTTSTISSITFGAWVRPGQTRPALGIFNTALTESYSITQSNIDHSKIIMVSSSQRAPEIADAGVDTWQHWAMSFNIATGAAKLYVDGVNIQSFTFTSIGNIVGAKIRFSTTEGYGYPYSSGFVDGIFAYEGILDDSTIAELANSSNFVSSGGEISPFA